MVGHGRRAAIWIEPGPVGWRGAAADRVRPAALGLLAVAFLAWAVARASGEPPTAAVELALVGPPAAPELRLRGHADQVLEVALSSDGTLLASVGADRTVRLWELPSGRELRTLRVHDSYLQLDRTLWRVALSSNAWWVAASAGDGTVRVWETGSGQAVAVLRVTGTPDALAFAPDGGLLAVAAFDGRVILFDVEARAAVGTLEVGDVRDLAFSDDSRSLSAVDHAGAARRWEVRSGDELPAQSLSAPDPPVSGRGLVVGKGTDGVIALWRASGQARTDGPAPRLQSEANSLGSPSPAGVAPTWSPR